MADPRIVRIGTRASRLALKQTEIVIRLLSSLAPRVAFEVQTVTTAGDRRRGPGSGKGAFTADLSTALVENRVDLAVHSLKDLPGENHPGTVIGAVCCREDPSDVLVAPEARSIDQLPSGARIGTSSVRRRAQAAAARPDIELTPVSGNVDTRLQKLRQGNYDALILAAAGLLRLGVPSDLQLQYLPYNVMLPAPGQAALAIQCRAEDSEMTQLLAAADHPGTRAAIEAERGFSRMLEGDCDSPIGAAASSGTELVLEGIVAAPDGSRIIRVRATGGDPDRVATGAADEALRQGARELLQ